MAALSCFISLGVDSHPAGEGSRASNGDQVSRVASLAMKRGTGGTGGLHRLLAAAHRLTAGYLADR
jgi:hypothetical protein